MYNLQGIFSRVKIAQKMEGVQPLFSPKGGGPVPLDPLPGSAPEVHDQDPVQCGHDQLH